VVRFPELALGPTQPPIHWAPTTFSTGVNRPEHEAFSTEVKNGRSYASNFPYSFMACTDPLPSFFVRFRLRFWTGAAVCFLLDFRLFSAALPMSGCGNSLTNVLRITCDVNSLFVPSAYRKTSLLVTRRMTNRVSNILCKMTNGTHTENDTLLLKERLYILFLFIVIYFIAVGQYLLLKYLDRTITILLFPINLLYRDLSLQA
jgi:hypothetical protein